MKKAGSVIGSAFFSDTAKVLISAINLQSRKVQFAYDIQTIYENAIFGWLLCPVGQHGVALPQDEAIGLP